jgi:hypothetical protein
MKLKRLAFEHARRGRLQAARRWFGGCLLLAAANAGCLNDAAMVPELQQQTMDLENRLAACNRELAARDAQIADLRRRVNNRPVLENVAVDDLFTVDRIEIVSRSGGADFDGQPGDDGVVIYVRPLDADGDVLKAAGRFTIQLLDLTDPGAPRTLFQYEVAERSELVRTWHGGMLTDHYTFRCRLPRDLSPPPPRDIHVRVTFLDWLTGRQHVDSTDVTLQRIDP